MSERKDLLVAYILWFCLGFLGIHRFYLNRPVSGIIWLLTGGLFGIGWLIDICLIPMMVDEENQHAMQPFQTVVHHHTAQPVYTHPYTPQQNYVPPQSHYVPPQPQTYPPQQYAPQQYQPPQYRQN